MARTSARFADAAHEWLRYTEEERGRKPSTLADYRSIVSVHLIPAFGEEALERVDAQMIERWLARLHREGALFSRRSVQKLVVVLNGIFRRAQKVWKLPHNPVSDVERFAAPERTDIVFFTPEEIHALAHAASNQQDASLFLAAAFTGLRMGELLRVALARCRLLGADHTGDGQLHSRQTRDAEVRPRPRRSPGRRGRPFRWPACPSADAGRTRTTWCSSAERASISTGRAAAPVQESARCCRPTPTAVP